MANRLLSPDALSTACRNSLTPSKTQAAPTPSRLVIDAGSGLI
jgi:hypothetical protein